jgi:hypothetical protein
VWIRAGNDQAYAQVLAFSLYQWTQDRDTVLLAIKGEGFSDLNAWKQHGFYVSVDGNAFMTPREAVDPNLAEAVHQFAWRTITTLDFVLTDGNLERYIEIARSIRSKLAEADHQTIEEVGQHSVEILFGDASTFVNAREPIN